MTVSVICGFDEAGRGPMAGPVYAAAVILPPDFPVDILNDSKKLSEKRRLEVEPLIKERACWGIGYVDHKTIDEIKNEHEKIDLVDITVIPIAVIKLD